MDEVIEDASKKYQGLVPLVYNIETMGLDEARPQDMPYAVYLKREADKVISELEENHKKEVEELIYLIRDRGKNFIRAFDSEEKEIRHQKYKRCLAMAKWCEARLGAFPLFVTKCAKERWLQKWNEHWLKIAEQFKEAK